MSDSDYDNDDEISVGGVNSFDVEYGAEEQADDGGAVEFGWEEPEKKLSGRRKKAQKKAKLGTFGMFYDFSSPYCMLVGI